MIRSNWNRRPVGCKRDTSVKSIENSIEHAPYLSKLDTYLQQEPGRNSCFARQIALYRQIVHVSLHYAFFCSEQALASVCGRLAV